MPRVCVCQRSIWQSKFVVAQIVVDHKPFRLPQIYKTFHSKRYVSKCNVVVVIGNIASQPTQKRVTIYGTPFIDISAFLMEFAWFYMWNGCCWRHKSVKFEILRKLFGLSWKRIRFQVKSNSNRFVDKFRWNNVTVLFDLSLNNNN